VGGISRKFVLGIAAIFILFWDVLVLAVLRFSPGRPIYFNDGATRIL